MKTWEKIVAGVFGAGTVAAVTAEVLKTSQEKPKAMTIAFASTKQDFIKKMKDAIGTQIPEAGRLLAIAWAAFESNWGRATGFSKANNPFNITAGSKWTGDTVPGPDTEYDSEGHVKNISQQWRKYNTLADAVGDMVTFLTISNPDNLNGRDKLFQGDVGFVDSLYRGHYFTLPPDRYKGGVQTCLDYVKANSNVA